MKHIARTLIGTIALLLAALAITLSARREAFTDYLAIVMGGRVSVIAAPDRRIVLTMSDYQVLNSPRWAIALDRTTPLLFGESRFVTAATRDIGCFGFRFTLGDRTVGQARSAHALELQSPQWVLLVPLALMIASWYRRVCIRSARFERGECVWCGYDLRGSGSDRCSECGKRREKPNIYAHDRKGCISY